MSKNEQKKKKKKKKRRKQLLKESIRKCQKSTRMLAKFTVAPRPLAATQAR
jgi:hypothetical protein